MTKAQKRAQIEARMKLLATRPGGNINIIRKLKRELKKYQED